MNESLGNAKYICERCGGNHPTELCPNIVDGERTGLESPGSSNGTEKSVEVKESLDVAKEKLDKVMSPNFKEYAVRFVHFGEYQKILEQQKFEPREIYVPLMSSWYNYGDTWGGGKPKWKYKEALSFERYLEAQGNAGDWENTAVLQTFMDVGSDTIRDYRFLRMILKEARATVKKEQGVGGNYREVVLDRFRERMLSLKPHRGYGGTLNRWAEITTSIQNLRDLKVPQEISDGIAVDIKGKIDLFFESEYTDDDTDHLRKIMDKLNTAAKPMSGDVEVLWWALHNALKPIEGISPEDRKDIMKFVIDSTYIRKEGNFRKILALLAKNSEHNQYHMALIFDTNAVSEEKNPFAFSDEEEMPEWKFLKSADKDPKQNEHLLAAVVVVPDRKFSEEVAKLSSMAGSFSHPVFDASGHIRYPKEKRKSTLNKVKEEAVILQDPENTESADLVNKLVELYDSHAMVKVIQYYILYPNDPSMARRYAHDGEGDAVWEKFEQMVDLIKSISDRATALSLVKRKGRLLYFMSDVFKNDPEIVIAALRTGTELYEHLPEELKKNREVALAAAGYSELTKGTNDVYKIMELPEEFRKDKTFVIEFLRRNGHQLIGLSLAKKEEFPELEKLYHDKDVIMAAVESTPRSIQALPKEFVNDREIILKTVGKDGFYLSYWSYNGRMNFGEEFDKNLCDDIEIATEAVKQNPKAIEYVGDKLKNDPRILALLPKVT